jgi:hypothetical protein
MGLPQTRQNVLLHPLGRFQVWARSSPDTQRKLRAAVSSAALDAVPETFRQSEQWHWPIGLTLPLISNRTPLQRQLPRITVASSDRHPPLALRQERRP